MCGSGALRTNDHVLRQLQAGPGGRIIIANHPSIVDAPIILSRVPGLVCVFKSSLKRSFTMGRTARTLGYLSNEEGIVMIKEMAQLLKEGDQVLFFPEGTRTAKGEILNSLNAGYALAAMRAGVPVQLVCIRAESPILTKRQHFLKAGRFPVVFQFEIGPSIEPGTFNTVRQYNDFVEQWFRENLSSSLPSKRTFLPASTLPSESEPGRLRFTVPADPFYCRGHMPGHPLVPAYAQMSWVHELLDLEAGSPVRALQYFRWKFLKPVLPGDAVEIVITGESIRREVVIIRNGERATQGRISILAEEPQR